MQIVRSLLAERVTIAERAASQVVRVKGSRREGNRLVRKYCQLTDGELSTGGGNPLFIVARPLLLLRHIMRNHTKPNRQLQPHKSRTFDWSASFFHQGPYLFFPRISEERDTQPSRLAMIATRDVRDLRCPRPAMVATRDVRDSRHPRRAKDRRAS